MNELEHLKTMWSPKVRRDTTLIVPKVTYINREGSLNNSHWKYRVTFAFRGALDIIYQERKKDKKPYMVWTQGPLIAFKEGDILTAKDSSKLLQVRYAKPMGWDISKSKMDEGYINFLEFEQSASALSKIGEHVCTQMQFLELLIHGSYLKVT